MGFITPCFIRKNTPELRKKLEKLGYKYSSFDDLRLDCIITFTSRNEYSVWANRHFNETKALHSYVDCGTNEELFLALAALRDDTDIRQWIIDEANECFGYDDSWMICDKTNMNDRFIYTKYRKATKEEIIERFKD